MIELHKRFGEVIRRRRIAAGWSQEEFADRAGLSRSYSGEVERGYSIPSLATVLKIAAAFGVPLSELVEEAEDTDSANPDWHAEGQVGIGGKQP